MVGDELTRSREPDNLNRMSRFVLGLHVPRAPLGTGAPGGSATPHAPVQSPSRGALALESRTAT